jgi:hypothetical protein
MIIKQLTPEEHRAIALLCNYLRKEGHDSDINLLRRLLTEHDLMVKVLADLNNTHRHTFNQKVDAALEELFKAMSASKTLKGPTNET